MPFTERLIQVLYLKIDKLLRVKYTSKNNEHFGYQADSYLKGDYATNASVPVYVLVFASKFC